jgi:hypothetical protein
MALLVLGPERMLTPSIAVTCVSAAAGTALTVPTSSRAANSVTAAIRSQDARALNSFPLERHMNFSEQTRSARAVTSVTKTSSSPGL